MGKILWTSKNLDTMRLTVQRTYLVLSYLIAYILHSCILLGNCSSFLFLLSLFLFLCFLSYSRGILQLYTWMCEIKQQIPEGLWTHLQYVNWLAGWNSVVYITPNSAEFYSFHSSSYILWYYNGCPLPLSCRTMKATVIRVQSEVQLPLHLSDIPSTTPDLPRHHSEVQVWAVKMSLLRHTMKAIPKTCSTYKSQVRNPEQTRLLWRSYSLKWSLLLLFF